ncbi:DNA-directed DNA polymerase, partial [Pseudozyma hubeiensis]
HLGRSHDTFKIATASELRSSRPSTPDCTFIPISSNMTKFAFICMVATAFASVVSAAPLIPSSIAEVAAQDVDILERTGPSNGADASTFLSVDNLSNALARLKPIRTPRAPIFETIQDEPAIKTLAQQTSQEHRSVFEINGKRTRASESSTYAERGSRLRHVVQELGQRLEPAS